jgi:hypothetical protein
MLASKEVLNTDVGNGQGQGSFPMLVTEKRKVANCIDVCAAMDDRSDLYAR